MSLRQCRRVLVSVSSQLAHAQPLFLKPVGNLSRICRIMLMLLELSRALGIISRSWKPQYFTQLEDELQRLQLLPLDLGVLPNKPRSSASLKTTTDWQLDEV